MEGGDLQETVQRAIDKRKSKQFARHTQGQTGRQKCGKTESMNRVGGGQEKVITPLPDGRFQVNTGRFNKIFDDEEDLRAWKNYRRDLKRDRKQHSKEMQKVCFSCRQAGHKMSDCPLSGADQKPSGICFHCGSADHRSSRCTAKQQNFAFAKCFICGEDGHLSRSCPSNPRGLYPNGGGCLLCSATDHLKKDCALLKKERALEKVAPKNEDVKVRSVDEEAGGNTMSCDYENFNDKDVVTDVSMAKKKRKVVVIS